VVDPADYTRHHSAHSAHHYSHPPPLLLVSLHICVSVYLSISACREMQSLTRLYLYMPFVPVDADRWGIS